MPPGFPPFPPTSGPMASPSASQTVDVPLDSSPSAGDPQRRGEKFSSRTAGASSTPPYGGTSTSSADKKGAEASSGRDYSSQAKAVSKSALSKHGAVTISVSSCEMLPCDG
jgi:hypothetical protein